MPPRLVNAAPPKLCFSSDRSLLQMFFAKQWHWTFGTCRKGSTSLSGPLLASASPQTTNVIRKNTKLILNFCQYQWPRWNKPFFFIIRSTHIPYEYVNKNLYTNHSLPTHRQMLPEGLRELTVLGSGTDAMEQHWPVCYSQEVPSLHGEQLTGVR